MIQSLCRIREVTSVGPGIFVMCMHAPEIASRTKPGQFVNLKVHDLYLPLLRRPFSVYRVDGEYIEIIFNIVGESTKILSLKKKDDWIDIIGPLGHPYSFDDTLATVILVGGGLGVASLPLLTNVLRSKQKQIVTFLGARNREQIVSSYLEDVHIATDDGSSGFHGTVVQLLDDYLSGKKIEKTKIFACGPNPMLNSLAIVAKKYSLSCEISLERIMACGIGLCQGCPVETINGASKYALVCMAGPVFEAQSVKIL